MTDKPSNLRVWAENGQTVDPGDGKYDLGWQVEIPTHEAMNYIQQQMSQMLVHINEKGVADWDALTTYPFGALVTGSNGSTYKALAGSTNSNPLGNPGDWEVFGGASTDFTTRLSTLLVVDVGPSGDYATINEALRAVSINHVEYNINDTPRVVIQLEAGFVINEQIIVWGIDLSWITISTFNGITPHIVNNSAITETVDGELAFVSVTNGGVSPILNFSAEYDITGSNPVKHGYRASKGSKIMGGNCGISKCWGDGLRLLHSSSFIATGTFIANTCTGIGMYLNGEASAVIFETVDVSECGSHAISCHIGSSLSIGGNVDAGDGGGIGLYCTTGAMVSITGDLDCEFTTATGIDISSLSEVTISGQATASRGDSHGVRVTDGAKFVVTGLLESLTHTAGQECLYLFQGATVLCGGYTSTGGENGIYAEGGCKFVCNGAANISGTLQRGISPRYDSEFIFLSTLAIDNCTSWGISSLANGRVSVKDLTTITNCGTTALALASGAQANFSTNLTFGATTQAAALVQSGSQLTVGGILECTGYTTTGLSSDGGSIDAVDIRAQKAGSDTSSDLVVSNGGMIRGAVVSGGANVTQGTFTAAGYVNK